MNIGGEGYSREVKGKGERGKTTSGPLIKSIGQEGDSLGVWLNLTIRQMILFAKSVLDFKTK